MVWEVSEERADEDDVEASMRLLAHLVVDTAPVPVPNFQKQNDQSDRISMALMFIVFEIISGSFSDKGGCVGPPCLPLQGACLAAGHVWDIMPFIGHLRVSFVNLMPESDAFRTARFH